MSKISLKSPLPPAKPVYKTFEIAFAQEPTQEQMNLIYKKGCSWHNIKVIKEYPKKITKEKTDYDYWIVKFDVPESDWLFWCGFIAGRSLGISVGKEGDPLVWYNKKNKLPENQEPYFYHY